MSGRNPTFPMVIGPSLESRKFRGAPAVLSGAGAARGIAKGQAVDEKEKRRLFDEVFLPHLVPAYRLARWLTGNASDAEDVVQESSLRAFRGIAGFGGVNARAWSLSVVRNTAYSWLMRNRPAAVVLTEDLGAAEQKRIEQTAEEDGSTPEAILLARSDAEEVRSAIARLPAPFREVIVLREFQDLNYRDIAEITQVPIGTVMSRLARARRMLMTALKDGS